MAKYLIEETITSQAVQGILQKPEDRSKVLGPIFKAAGCMLEQFYVSGIENKALMIAESPDLESIYTLMMAFQAGGTAVSIKCTPLIPVSEAVDLFKKAARLDFNAPGK